MTLRAFRLTGVGREQALDLLHVHADVQGVVEEESAITVWLATGMPALDVAGLRVEELPAAVANATATGLERDRAIAVADDLLVRPPSVFVKSLVLKRGFVDGWRGVVIAAMAAYTDWLKYWRLLRQPRRGGAA